MGDGCRRFAKAYLGRKRWGRGPISANLECFSSRLPQNRHPERSASQIYRVTQRLWRGAEEPVLSVAEGTSAVLIFPILFGAFQLPSPDRVAPLRFFPGAENQELAGTWGWKMITVHEKMYP